jgi:recombination protein RecA
MKKDLTPVIAAVNKKYGEGSAFLGRNMQFPKIPRLSSGVFSLDSALGGGWPRGRLHHLYGPFSTGKSFLSLKAIVEAQNSCMWCSQYLDHCTCGAQDPMATAYIDVEGTFDPIWAKRVGVDEDYLIVSRPPYGELVIDLIDQLIRTGDVGLIILDSIAALTFAQQIEKGAEDSEQPGLLAKHMTRGLKKWTTSLLIKLAHPTQKTPWDNLCTLIMTNQIRDVINSRYPAPPQPPGGNAVRHYSSCAVNLKVNDGDVEYTELDKKTHEQHALKQLVRFKTTKNKTYMPFKSGSYTIDFNSASVDNDYQIYLAGLHRGIISAKGAWYQYGDIKVQGEEKMFKAIQEAKLFPKVSELVLAAREIEIQNLMVTTH